MGRESAAPVPVIIFVGFCNWLEFNGVLGFWDEKDNPFSGILFSRHL